MKQSRWRMRQQTRRGGSACAFEAHAHAQKHWLYIISPASFLFVAPTSRTTRPSSATAASKAATLRTRLAPSRANHDLRAARQRKETPSFAAQRMGAHNTTQHKAGPQDHRRTTAGPPQGRRAAGQQGSKAAGGIGECEGVGRVGSMMAYSTSALCSLSSTSTFGPSSSAGRPDASSAAC